MSPISSTTAAPSLPVLTAAPATPKQDSDGDHDNSPASEVSDSRGPGRTLNVLA